jgi:hypothetical protein
MRELALFRKLKNFDKKGENKFPISRGNRLNDNVCQTGGWALFDFATNSCGGNTVLDLAHPPCCPSLHSFKLPKPTQAALI